MDLSPGNGKMGLNLMAARAGNPAFRRLTGLNKALEEESSSEEADAVWQSEDCNWSEGLPHRSSMASTTYTDSEPPHKFSLDLSTPPHSQVHFFPTSQIACQTHCSSRSESELFDRLSTQDLTKALADVKSLRELVESLDTEIENVCLRDLRKPLRILKCVALPEASSLMRRRSTNP